MSLNPCIRDWRDRRVWVIGASSGIGAALARVLLAQGARVALSARSTPGLAEIAAMPGANTLVLPLDVTDAASVAPALQQMVAAWGGIDLVLWCAGSHSPVRAWELDAADARRLVDVNLNGVINGLPAVVGQLLLQKSGGIAIVSSVAGYGGLPTALVYGATKAALIMLTEMMAQEWAPDGIRANAVCPGFVHTSMTDAIYSKPILARGRARMREVR